MFIAILLLAGCQTTPTVIEPTPENVAAQFESVAFGSDFGGAFGRIQRWQASPTWQLYAKDGAVDPHLENLEILLGDIRSETGFLIDVPPDDARATVHVVFAPRRDFSKYIPREFNRPGVDFDAFIGGNACLGLTLSNDAHSGIINGAVILIGTDISASLQRQCVPEEIVQMLGLIADACGYRRSIFCEADDVERLTEADKILLRTLYDPRLKPGMTKAEAMPIAREIIAEQMR